MLTAPIVSMYIEGYDNSIFSTIDAIVESPWALYLISPSIGLGKAIKLRSIVAYLNSLYKNNLLFIENQSCFYIITWLKEI